MKCRVGLYDRDKNYAMNLMDYFNRIKDLPFTISMFTGEGAIEESINKGKVDMFLLDECVSPMVTDIPIMHICEDREKAYKDDYIYKYQDAREIAEKIKKYAGKLVCVTTAQCVIYGVYSPIGRCGKTQLAKGICDYYGDSVYVGLEEFSPENQGNQEFISDFVYYLSINASEIVSLVDRVVSSERGVKYIYGRSTYLDLRQVSLDNIKWFTKTFHDSGYKRIVFDVGQASLSDINILGAFDRIIVPVLEDEISVGKIETFKELIKNLEVNNIVSKIKYVKIPYDNWENSNIRECIEKEGL